MNPIEIPPFYVGQEVVANKTGKRLVEGKCYVINRIYRSPCKCGYWEVIVGVPTDSDFALCSACGHKEELNGESIFNAALFEPKLQFTEFISMKEVSEKALELTAAN